MSTILLLTGLVSICCLFIDYLLFVTVCQKVKELILVIQDDDRLRDERKKARKTKDKYIGMAGEAISHRYSWFHFFCSRQIARYSVIVVCDISMHYQCVMSDALYVSIVIICVSVCLFVCLSVEFIQCHCKIIAQRLSRSQLDQRE